MNDTRLRLMQFGTCVAIACAAGATPARAQDKQDPPTVPAELLEYLGSWEGDDSDWLAATLPREARASGAKPDDRPVEEDERGEKSPLEQNP